MIDEDLSESAEKSFLHKLYPMSKPLAIVIPAYKSTFLRETLESIANQTDNRFTLYIGDDCSPHDLKSIVDEFKNRINIIYHRFEENLGGKDLVAHWERCIALTDGEPYIWLFSDDDTMDSHCVESFNSLPDQIKDNSLVHFNIKMIDVLDGGNVKDLPAFPPKLSAGDYLEAKLRGKVVSYVIEFVFSRKLYDKVGGFQNFDLAWGSDFMTWLKMSAESPNGIVTIEESDSYVNWRKSGENISPNKTRPILLRKLKSYIENAVFVKRELEQSPEKYAPLKKEFRWLRFPLGEFYRNRHLLSNSDVKDLCKLYASKVGYHLHSIFAFSLITMQKLLIGKHNN